MLESGIFPDSLKIAKIIPLYKKENINSITNYQPISLLQTLSHIFERVIYSISYILILIITIFYQNQLLNCLLNRKLTHVNIYIYIDLSYFMI